MVDVGSGGNDYAAGHHGGGLLFASKSIISTGFSRTVCASSSGPRSHRLGVLVRSLHHLSAYANSPDSPAADRERRTVSFNQRERGGHDSRSGFGRPEDFQQSLLSKDLGVHA